MSSPTLYKKWFSKNGKPKHHFYWWYQYTDTQGKRIRRAAYPDHNPTNVLKEAKQYVNQLEIVDPTTVKTLKEYSKGFFDKGSPWVNWRKDFNIKDVTLDGHSNFLDNYFLKKFGDYNFQDLKAKDIEKWL